MNKNLKILLKDLDVFDATRILALFRIAKSMDINMKTMHIIAATKQGNDWQKMEKALRDLIIQKLLYDTGIFKETYEEISKMVEVE